MSAGPLLPRIRQVFRGARLPILCGLLLTALLVRVQMAPGSAAGELIERIDYLVYDFRFELLPPVAGSRDHRIVIVDIDEKSLAAEGRWPWSRFRLAQLVEQLADNGVVVVGFDVVLSEPERNMAARMIERLAREGRYPDLRESLAGLRADFDADAAFAARLDATDVVLAWYLHSDQPVRTGRLPEPLMELEVERVGRISLPDTRGYTTALPLFQSRAAGVGFVSIDPDKDGAIRRSPLVMRHGTGVHASFPLALARAYLVLDETPVRIQRTAAVDLVSGVTVTDRPLRTDALGRVIVPFQGGRGSFPYYSATDVLNGRVDPDELFNSVALVGTSAVGLADLRATPLDKNFPGVEVHAAILDGILNSGFPYRPDWEQGATLALLAVSGVLAAVAFPLLGAGLLTLTGLFLLCAVVASNFWFWAGHGLDLPLAAQVLLVVGVMVLNLVFGFLRESMRRRTLKSMFDQYVPPQHIDSLLRRRSEGGLDEGETRNMTVLFADVQGFTAISEDLDAARIKELLNCYLTPVTRVIFDHRGTIDKYVGDLVVAFWGAPLDNPGHAADGVAAGLEMLRVVDELQDELMARRLPRIPVGIGINSGEMNVGDMGSVYRRAYTVLGDAVNLASRIENLTRTYGVPLIVGEQTRNAAPQFEYRLLDRIRVVGKIRPTSIYQPLGRVEEVSAATLQRARRFEEGLSCYFDRQWERAERIFREIGESAFDGELVQVFLDRIARFRADGLPERWDGSYRLERK